MDKKQIVKNFIKAIEQNDIQAVDHLDDDFIMDLPVPMHFGSVELLTFMQMVKASMPDLVFDIKTLSENGNKISASISSSGTYQNDFIMPGYFNVAASGQPINIPDANFEFIFLNNKISQIKILGLPSGMNLMKDIDYQLPGNN